MNWYRITAWGITAIIVGIGVLAGSAFGQQRGSMEAAKAILKARALMRDDPQAQESERRNKQRLAEDEVLAVNWPQGLPPRIWHVTNTSIIVKPEKSWIEGTEVIHYPIEPVRAKLMAASPAYVWLQRKSGSTIANPNLKVLKTHLSRDDQEYVWVRTMAALKRSPELEWPPDALARPVAKSRSMTTRQESNKHGIDVGR